ncbi:ABC transporter ATP-binding protein/permease [Boudabousia marimammalium]|uniref:Thiol reductant ABC exporter subunit CydC n=1 Tax=Boudabousia marimammalium TaxID=156892 RepID=A0A1Q5PJE9_9ACTO|nr:ABC transporter ATP-binding protein [Boudabousia marimammalium]OKL46006.1 hypothetical protein BM477_07465 [Boudabousia marimammalium]
MQSRFRQQSRRKNKENTAQHPAIATKQDKLDNQMAILVGGISVVGAAWMLTLLGLVIDTAYAGLPVTRSLIIPLIISGLIASTAAGLRVWMSNRSAVRAENRVRSVLADTSMVKPLSPQTEGEDRLGSQINLMNDGVERLTLYRQTFIPQIGAALAIPVLTLLWIAVVIDWVSALVIFISIPLIPILVRGFMLVLKKVSSNSRRARNELAAAYLDAIEGMDTLQLLGASQRVGQKLAAQGEVNRLSIMRLLSKNQLVLFVIDISFSMFIVAAAAIMAVIRIDSGAITVGAGATLVLMSIFLIEPIDQVGAFFYVGMGGMASQRAINRYLSAEEVTPEQPTESENISIDSAPAVALKNVSFSYGELDVLKHADLEVKSGQHIAIVGPSGQGKSTLLKLVQGSLTPAEGQIFLNDKPLTAQQLRSHSAVVAQRTWLFAGTVADNLALVAPDATEEEMWQALDTAHVGDEIRSLPNGLDTVVGERGYGLSGGQAQRISIARALLSRRHLLLMDEPTSAVDLHSEALISQALGEIGNDRTMIMVTHRHGLLPSADQILEVKKLQVNTLSTGSDFAATEENNA